MKMRKYYGGTPRTLPTFLKEPAALLGMVLLLGGLLLIVIGVLLAHRALGPVPEIVGELGRVMAATGILSLGYEIVIRRDLVLWVLNLIRLRENVWRTGISHVHAMPPLTEGVKDWIETSIKSVDILGAAASTVIASCLPQLTSALDNGVRVRLLILKRDSKHVQDRIQQEGRAVTPLLKNIETTHGFIGILREEAKRRGSKGELHVYEYDQVPYCGMVLVDGRNVRYSPYMPGKEAIRTPAFDFTCEERHPEDCLVSFYQRAFDDLISNATELDGRT
jgi:hypothetical protein